MNKYITLLAILIIGIVGFFIAPNFSIVFPKIGFFLLFFFFIALIAIFYINLKKLNLSKLSFQQELEEKKEEFQAGKKRLRLTIENIQEGIIITDDVGKILDVNKKTLQILDITEDKIVGAKVQNLIHLKENGDNLNFSNTFKITVENKKSFSLTNLTLQIPNTKKIKNVDDSLSPILDENDHVVGTIMIFRDVTNNLALQKEKVSLTQKIDQLERMSILGDFLSGIAHNFGNVISNINGSVEMMKQDPANKKMLEKHFNRIDKKVEESKQLIKKLSVFNTSIEFEKTPVSLNKLIDINKTSLLKILPGEIEINVNLKSESTIKIDIVDFDRLFLTVLSFIKKNITKRDSIFIRTYDDESAILEFETQLIDSEIDFYMFNIKEILKRNDAELITISENDKTKVKILFKI